MKRDENLETCMRIQTHSLEHTRKIIINELTSNYICVDIKKKEILITKSSPMCIRLNRQNKIIEVQDIKKFFLFLFYMI